MAIMGPTQVAVIKAGEFTREAMMATWGPVDAASKTMTFDQTVDAIQKQSGEYARLLNDWSEADFRGEVNMLGTIATRGRLLVTLVLCSHAA